MRRLAPLLSLLCATCVTPREPAESTLSVSLSALSLVDVGDVLWDVQVKNGASEVVWSRRVSSSRSGDGAGSALWIGPCDASAESRDHTVEVWVVGLYDAPVASPGQFAAGQTTGPGQVSAPSLPFVSPSASGPLVRQAACQANADTLVDFDLTILRPAQQGFFDVAVSLSSIFCSAKFDCCDLETGDCPLDGSLDHRLLFDESGARASTFVLGFACAADPNLTANTHLYLDALQLDCTSPTGESFTADLALDPSGTPGNQCTPGNLSACAAVTESNLDADTYLYQLGVYRGTQTLAADPPVDMVYWNLALGVKRPAIGSCRLRLRGSADDALGTPLVSSGRVSPGLVYPYIEWDVTLGACGQEPLSYDGSSMVSTRYTALDGEALAFAYGYGSGQVSGPFCDPICVRGECVGGTCLCPDGYSGPSCDIAANPCAPSPCLNAGTCTATGPLTFTCACPPTHSGPTCADLAPPPPTDPCDPNPCLNSGSCTATGVSTFSCECPPTHSGPTCAELVPPTDPCAPNPCLNSGTCTATGPETFTCACPAGFSGLTCQTPDACAPNPCANNGTCSTTPDGFVCDCTSEYGGLTCEVQLPCGTQDGPCESGFFCSPAGICLPEGTTQNPEPVATSPGAATLLPGATEVFTIEDGNAPYIASIVTGGGELDYDPNAFTLSFTAPDEPGLTTLRVTDAFGVSFDILVDTTPPLGLSPIAVPTSSTTVLVPSGGLAPYTLQLLGPGSLAGTSYTAPAAPTTTSILVTDAALNTFEAPLTIYAPLTLSPNPVSLATNATTSFTSTGGFGAKTFSVASGGGSFASNTYTAPSTAGSATVRVTDQLGNTATATVTIYPPLVISPSAPTVEVNKTVVFSASGGQGPYTFTKPSGGGTLVGTTYTAPGTAGSATVRVTDQLGNTRDASITIIAAVGGACASAPCLNGGVCVLDAESETGYVCDCAGDYAGDNCEIEPPPCGDSPLPCDPGFFCTVAGVCLPDGTTPNPTPLAISPPSETLLVSTSRTFTATGGNAPYTYFISAGDGSMSGASYTAPSYATTASVTVRDAFGTTSSAPITIRPPLQISPSTITIAVNGSVTFSATGGIGSYYFSRVSGGGSLAGSTYTAPATTGTAVVRVADSAGHRSEATITIANFAIVPTNPIVLTNQSLVFSTSGGTSPYTYTVTSGGGSFSGPTYTAPATPGTATVRVTSQNGWTSSTTVTIVAPLTISPDAPLVMAGRTQSFTTSGGYGAVSFSKPSGEGSLAGSTFTAPLTPGTATIRATDSIGHTADATVTIYPVLELSPAESYVLSGETVTFDATGGYGAYTYSVLSGGGSFAGSTYSATGAAGPSIVRVTDSLGNTDSAVVTVYGYTMVAGGGVSALNATTTYGHACGVRSDGTLWCWGSNANGQLGDGTVVAKTYPVRIGTADNWSHVATGDIHSCATRTDGSLWCWGNNGGRLGDGTTTQRTAPVRVGVDNDWFMVAAGNAHTCAIKTTGTLWCWGVNGSGQLGQGNTTTRTTPFQVGTLNTWSSVVATRNNATCATRNDGTLWCWGANTTGNLGQGNTTTSTSPVQVGAGVTTWSELAAGHGHVCATRTDGTLWCWGRNSNSQLGDASTTQRNAPVQVGAAIGSWSRLAAGGEHTCATRTSGELYCWGKNAYGQVGDGTTTLRNAPTRVGTATDWVRLGAGPEHTCASKVDGTLHCWGWNTFGQLGSTGTTNVMKPVRALTGATGVSTSDQGHSCATLANGTTSCWGWNATYYMLGDGTAVNKTRPVQVVGGITNWTRPIDGFGRYHTCAHRADNRLSCWGRSVYGVLGNASTATAQTPVDVVGGTVWSRAAAGYYHMCGVRTNGTLWCWGYNNYGQVGNGTTGTGNISSPVQVGTVTTWSDVAAGQYFTCGLRANGTLWCWGLNNYSQVGDGTTTTRTSPVQIGTASWSDIAAGQQHACGIQTNGRLYCWGRNDYGRLGTGNTTIQRTPFLVDANSTWSQVTTGYTYSCGIKTDGSLWCWGYNVYGQLGVGDVTQRTVPTRVGADNDWAEVSAGQYHTCGRKTSGEVRCWGRNNYGQVGATDKCADNTVFCQVNPEPVH